MKRGFTLIEIVLTLLLVGILSAVVAVQYQNFTDDGKSAVTKDRLLLLKRGIVGDSRLVSAGQYTFPGYESDLTALPDSLTDLVLNPATGNKTQTYDPLARTGWRGPYADDASDYSNDAWGRALIYDKVNRKMRSLGKNAVDEAGAGDDIEVTF